ncbi:putative membrane protein [Bartonella callosciuri]|uniref:Putative membrane protein n=1 Tax=Bartonella callosciuri TaxID=686223 RepID=A0A840NT15_9HYPH|nr:putative membrane protein [Bartonella callosciuri]
MIRFIYAALLAIIGAIIVHICVLFLIPYWTQNNIWTGLKKSGAPYQFFDLDVNNSIQQTTDPLFLLKVCRFDLENGPVHLKALKTTQFWSLAAYTYDGIIFYTLNDHTAPDATLDLIIGKPVQIIELKQSKPKNKVNSVLVAKNLNKGFALLRIFAPSFLAKKESEVFFSSATCRRLSE